MEHTGNILLTIKAAVVFAAGCFSAAFGWLGWLVLAWAVCMGIDWLTGTLAAAKRGGWSSASARSGIFHKAGMIAVVVVGGIADFVLDVVSQMLGLSLAFSGFVLPLVLVWFTVSELGSILENAVALGAPCPKFLRRILAVINAHVEKAVESGLGGETDEEHGEEGDEEPWHSAE